MSSSKQSKHNTDALQDRIAIVTGSDSGINSASKAELHNLTRGMAFEVAQYGVRVCGIGPGLIESPMTEEKTKNPEKRAKMEEKIPIGRVSTPEDIAYMIDFLCSDNARYCSEQIYSVDGRWLLSNPSMN
ncbi:unnamed protein product [Rotaria sp. Silwood1]|nr:unnamed protein product [Rotaria sp. Silwood1]